MLRDARDYDVRVLRLRLMKETRTFGEGLRV